MSAEPAGGTEPPILRVTGYDVPVPFFSNEGNYIPSSERLINAAKKIVDF